MWLRQMNRIDDIRYSGSHDLAMDLYLPASGTAAAAVVYVHGGGFRRGSRKAAEVVAFAGKLVPYGFAFAAVDHRLDTPITAFSSEDAAVIERLAARTVSAGLTLSPRLYGPAFYAALEDVSEAIQYLWVEGERFGITSREVGVLGVSSGGIAGVSLAFPPNGFYKRLARPEAVVAISGAVVQPWRLEEGAPPVLLFHGDDDRIIGADNIALAERKARIRAAPVSVVRTGVKGHASQVAVVLAGADAEGQGYFELVLDQFAPLQSGV